ncbi:MAG: DUF523 and DUF1722 domain-containing protein [Deltaproteobacteria bacterium]|nr:DUF523 and DUF1722 domain-containing protein [Deltaproteobacteria bacterium]
MSTIKLGLSACLLGTKVRYDGGHTWDPFVTDTLGRYLEFVPVCPETECGLGVPREPMRLVGDPVAPQLFTVRTKQELTGRLLGWAEKRVEALAQENLAGFILKSKSPSCGPARVKVYNDQGRIAGRGAGLFARAFRQRFPLLPVIDEAGLYDPEIRENFIERLFFWRRWRELLTRKPGLGDLVAFHTRHKYQLLAHSTEHYRQLGKLVARGRELARPALLADYQALALAALRLKATASKNANVLYHLLGYFKKQLSGDDKQEVLEAIDSYRRGEVPLLMPVTLINHYVRKYQEPYLKGQTYLHPHPLELRLRHHA